MPNDSTQSVPPLHGNATLIDRRSITLCLTVPAGSASPRFDLYFRTGRPINRLCGVLRNGDRTSALLRFSEAPKAWFRPRSLWGRIWRPFPFSHLSERKSLLGLSLNEPGSRCLHFHLIPFHHSVPIPATVRQSYPL